MAIFERQITKSSHVGHVAYFILLFLIGGLIGFGVGKAYETEHIAGESFDQTAIRLLAGSKKPSLATENTYLASVNWKTYTSSQNGFSIRYPQKGGEIEDEWMYGEYEGGGGVSFGLVSKSAGGDLSVDAARYMVINIEKNTYSSIDEWVQKETSSDSNPAKLPYSVKDMTIGGEAGKQVSVTGTAISVGVIKGDKLYHMTFSCAFCAQQENDLFNKIYLTMLSTLKFTD